MEREYIKNSELQEVTLLEKINQTLAELGSTSEWKRAPEFLESWAPLKDKTVAMVDDQKSILENLVPYVLVATNGKAFFVRYNGETIDDVTRQIIEHTPDIVVMDYHLSEGLKGTDVIKALREQHFAGEVVGFSSDDNAAKEFSDAGAKVISDKGLDMPEESVEKLAKIISKK